MNNVKSILLDTSFLIRLSKTDDEFHITVKDYLHYFLENKIILYLSTIAMSEYSVMNEPDNLIGLGCFRIIEFDLKDAIKAGLYRKELKGINTKDKRNIVINDLKLLAQIQNRNIHAIISKDKEMLSTMIKPLKEKKHLQCAFFDLTTPIKELLGTLF